jgi:putative FmdB family regulatory protein
MPLYDYKCKEEKCEHKFEALVRKHDSDEKVECPKCKSENTERQISSPSVSMGNPYMSHIRKI